MTGYYLILMYPPDNLRGVSRSDAAWHRIVAICRSLHSEGLYYNVALNLAPSVWGEVNRPHVLITAAGKGKAKRQSKSKLHLPQPVTAEYARNRGLEVEWFLPENRQKRNNGTTYWRSHNARYLELGAMAEEFLQAERDYWCELELLSGQRSHYKPGLSDDTRTDDDEVAA